MTKTLVLHSCALAVSLCLPLFQNNTPTTNTTKKKIPNNCAQGTGFDLISWTHPSLQLSPGTATPHYIGNVSFFLSAQPQKSFKAPGI